MTSTWLRAFSYTLLALATLVGAYVGAAAIGRAWLFWVLAPAAVFIATIYAGWERLKRAVRALANHQSTLNLVGQLQVERDELQRQLDVQGKKHSEALLAANEEGRNLVVGLMQSTLADAELEVLGAAVRDGTLLIAARPKSGSPPGVGAVYALSHSLLDMRQGLLRVVEESQEQGAVLMECIHEDEPEFWTALRRESVVKQELPPGLVLTVPTLKMLPALRTESGSQ